MTSLSDVFPHFNENNGNVLLPRIDTTPVPEVPGEVQDTDDGPIIMCGKLMGGWSFEKDDFKAKKITELVKKGEYQEHPQFKKHILVPNETTTVISSDENQYYRKIQGMGWVSTALHYNKHLSLEEYIKKYCKIIEYDCLLIHMYKGI
jgi:hypothetical protein